MTSVNLSKEHPAVYQSVVALEESIQQAAKAASIDLKLVQLVKIRVSQINGCAFCLRMHTREAIELGETTDRLAVIAAWWEPNTSAKKSRQRLRWQKK